MVNICQNTLCFLKYLSIFTNIFTVFHIFHIIYNILNISHTSQCFIVFHRISECFTIYSPESAGCEASDSDAESCSGGS